MGISVLFLTRLINISLILLALLFWGCQETRVVESSDSNIVIGPGIIYYKGELFTGKIHQENPVLQEEYITTYKEGREHGEYIARKKSGQLLEKRHFNEGLKHGIHHSWFPNGNNRLYSEFDNGKYINDRWEWYDTNVPYKYEKFDKNGKILVSKVWRKNGKIYMNNAFTENGASVGLPGSKNCDPIKPLENTVE